MPQRVQFNEHVTQISLPTERETFVGELATISGWGIYSDEGRRPSQTLNFVTLPVISNERCSLLFPFMVNENNICVSGLSRQGKYLALILYFYDLNPISFLFLSSGGCQGDSGGPLTIRRGGKSVQVGIVSFGMGLACESVWPTVFSRITFFCKLLS